MSYVGHDWVWIELCCVKLPDDGQLTETLQINEWQLQMKTVCGSSLLFNVGDPVGLLRRTRPKELCKSSQRSQAYRIDILKSQEGVGRLDTYT